MGTRSIVQGAASHPYHLSVGAVLVNDQNEVVCHYVKEPLLGAPGEYRHARDYYLLMRETPEAGETFEETLHRGLLEEFGATGEIVMFLGSQQAIFKADAFEMKKTTIYFLVRMTSLDEEKRNKEELEGKSEVVFLSPDECIANMKAQWERSYVETLNEAEIVERAKEYL